MNIFGLFKKRRWKAFVKKTEDLAQPFQLEVFKQGEALLSPRFGKETAGKAAAAIANYVFGFGHISSQHVSIPGLLEICEVERRNVLARFDDVFKTNATGMLILLGIAWEIEVDKFKRHLTRLAEEKFAKIGPETPNVSPYIPKGYEGELFYMYEIATIGFDLDAWKKKYFPEGFDSDVYDEWKKKHLPSNL